MNREILLLLSEIKGARSLQLDFIDVLSFTVEGTWRRAGSLCYPPQNIFIDIESCR